MMLELINKKKKERTGIEPVTSRSAVECSTTELTLQLRVQGARPLIIIEFLAMTLDFLGVDYINFFPKEL